MNDLYSIDSHKLHLHPSRVSQWLEATDSSNNESKDDSYLKLKKVYPLYVEISPCGQCNHRCTFCAVDYIGYKNISIDKSALRHCLADMSYHGIKSVMYAGEGEPLLYAGIDEIINYTKSLGIDVAITTNATSLTSELSRKCLSSITWIKASINAGNENTYSAIHKTKKSDFNRVFKNLSDAVCLREKHNYKVTLGAQAVLLPENVKSLSSLCEKCRDIGLNYLVIKPYSQQPSSSSTAKLYSNLDYSDDNFSDLEESLSSFNTTNFKVIYRENTIASLQESERIYSKCYATPMFWAYIMASGDVYGCGAHLLDDRFCYGNIKDSSFSGIWEGDKRSKNLNYVLNELDISSCRKNCRMEHVNRYLWELKNPNTHVNFI